MEPDNIFELKGKMPTKDGFLTQALLKKYFTRAKVASLHKDKEYSRIEMLWRDNFKAIDAKFWQYAEGIDTKGVPKHIQPNIVNPEWIARIKPYLRTWIWITRAEAGGTSQPATDVRIYLWHEHHVQCICKYHAISNPCFSRITGQLLLAMFNLKNSLGRSRSLNYQRTSVDSC